MKLSTFQTLFLGLILSFNLATGHANGMTCNPDPSPSPPASTQEVIACLQDLQLNIASKLIDISNYAPLADPESMRNATVDLAGWQTNVKAILLDAYTATYLTLKQKTALDKKYTSLFNFVSKAADLLNKNQLPSVVLAQIRNANNAHNQVGKLVAALGGNTTPIPTLASGGPDFWGVNKNVCFTISNCPTLGAGDVSIDNPYSMLGITPIKENSVTVTDLKGGKKKVCVVSGTSQGGASVVVNACGTLLRRLVYNYGNTKKDATGPGTPVTALHYSGACSGGYGGTYTVHFADGSPDQTGGVMGPVALSFDLGVVNITQPATGIGRIASSGKANARSAAFGALNFAPGIVVNWGGSVWFAAQDYPGATAAASGSWSTRIRFSGVSGTASGGWSVSCN